MADHVAPAWSGGLPDGITAEDILGALRKLDEGHDQGFSDSTGYDVLHAGKRYAPKAVIALAAERAAGRPVAPSEFSGGEGKRCFTILRQHGFEIVPKGAQGASSSSQSPTGTNGGDPRSDLLSPSLAAELAQLHGRLSAEGLVLQDRQLDAAYACFRERFGPEVLRNLDGERLLDAIHGRGTKDSLVYWLEFKDDDELPARFGSIAGGSALKFGIYRSTESGDWFTGSPLAQRRLSPEEAIEIVRAQRDQLVAGAALLHDLPASPAGVDFPALQREMVKAAPDLAETAWGHKYFALLRPDLIDDFHALEYQQYHLIKLLQLPASGRYENASFFVRIAQQLGVRVTNLTTALNHRNGAPHAYWRIGTTENDDSVWPEMRDGGYVAIGWNELGDLSELRRDQASKDKLQAAMAKTFPGPANVVSRKANEVFKFVTWVQQRDLVLAMEGGTVRGVGRIAGDYSFVAGGTFAHRRPVEWLSLSDWTLPRVEAPRTTFVRLGKHFPSLVEAERRILNAPPRAVENPTDGLPAKAEGTALAPLAPLSGVIGRVQAALQRKRQVILYGPPGTGKTYWAELAMRELAARSWLGKMASDLSNADRETLRQSGAFETCSFHPAYGYEDFIEGYRPLASNGGLAFERRDGVFKRLCSRAANDTKRQFFLLIDEVNRGDVPRIFGELLMVLEKDKRGKSVTLPLSGDAFLVPDNVYVIATMNTADRSVALLDAALRRRFAFVELMPDTSALAGVSVGGLPLSPWLEELNRRIIKHVGRDARNLQVGHAYLMPGGTPIQDLPRFAEILRDDIIPLLEEYCYENFEALSAILGTTIVQRDRQRIDDSLFLPERLDDLVHALLTAFDNITATKQAIVADAVGGTDDEDDDGPDDGEPPAPSASPGETEEA